MSKKTISTIIQLIIFLSIGIGLVVWRYEAISAKDKADMFSAFDHIRWFWVGPMFVVGLFSHYFRAVRWKILMRPVKAFPSTTNTLFAVLVGYLANTAVPRLGEVAKCTILAKYEKVPVDKLLGTMIAERAFDFFCVIILLLATLLLQFHIVYPLAAELGRKVFLDHSGHIKWLHFGMALLILIVVIYGLIRLARRMKKSKVGQFLIGIGDGLKAIMRIKEKSLFVLYTVLMWSMYTLLIIIGFWAMPDLDGITLIASLSVLTLGSFGMIATPGGIGAYPVIVGEVLLLYGINIGVGFAYGWVTWAGQTAIVVVFGLASLILLPIYNRKNKDGRQKNEGLKKDNESGNLAPML